MRIHRLEIQAFGPFATRQVIDFDELSAHGLFLLNGATGAGKTSVLDAICYALYGQVPGVRQDAKRLRSDHAEPGLAPEVSCEFSAAGRRLEATRNPAWSRPAKRANTTGTTTEQAKTLLREKIDGRWEQKSTRNDEASQEITSLLGMNREQFTRVVMLPQGEFAEFLRSSATDRQELLQQLFGTERFKEIEKQLAFDAAEAKLSWASAEAVTGSILQRAEDEAGKYPELLSNAGGEDGGERAGATNAADATDTTDTAGAAEPTGVADTADTPRTAGPGSGAERMASLQEQLHDAAAKAAAAAESADAAVVAARREQQELAAGAERASKLAGAEATEHALILQEPAQQERIAAVQQHRRAEVLASQLQAAGHAETAAHGAREAAIETLRELGRHPLGAKFHHFAGMATDSLEEAAPCLEEAATAAAGRIAVLEELLPEEQAYQQGRETMAQLERKQTECGEKAARADAAIASLAGQQQEARNEQSRLQILAAQSSHLDQQADSARALVDAITAQTEAGAALAVLEQQHRSAKERLLQLKEEWLRLFQQRLDHAAGELAQQLQAGEPCPVCGSIEHPSPSSLTAESSASADAEQTAREAQDRAEDELAEHTAALGRAQQELAVLNSRAGGQDLDQAKTALGGAVDAAGAARTARDRLNEGAETLAALTRREHGLTGSRDTSRSEAGAAAAEAAAVGHRLADLDTRLDAARDGCATLAERLVQLRGYARQLKAAREAEAAHRNAAAQVVETRRHLTEALAESSFADEDQARAALLESDEADAVAAEIKSFDLERRRVSDILDTEPLRRARQDQATGRQAPTPEALGAGATKLEMLTIRAREAGMEHNLLRQSTRQLDNLAGQLADAVATAGPMRERHQLLNSVAETARGGGENIYRMSLNTYVLAARLEQVAVAASERLTSMTDGRYSLIYSDALASHGKRSGLGLQVVDEWTGLARDTTTLSGGESFMASLALALGLADVVQQESGGVDIETLFVDEGFGSLDEEALEQVMDALEGLRDGGRVVGLVSHVAEMKLRIPAQLRVSKARTGSTLSVAAAVLSG